MSETSETRRRETRLYVAGLLLATTLTLIPFSLVAWGAAGPTAMAATIATCAVLQAAVHLRCFLHIDFSRQQREDLQLILFSLLLLALMAGGTVWVLANLAHRMH